MDDMLQSIKNILKIYNEPSKLLNFYQFKSFLEKLYKYSKMTKEIAREYTKDLESLINFIWHEFYSRCFMNRMKNWFTRT